jgi:hypothetical protein
VKEETEVETVDVDHDCFDLTYVSYIVAVELKVSVFVEALLLVTDGDVVEDVYLGGDLAMVGY